MKGTIEISQGAVLYIILMIVVIIIGIAIVTKGQFSILFEQKKFSTLFEPGKLAACIPEMTNKALCRDVSANDLFIDCTAGASPTSAAYKIYLKNLNFNYRDLSTKEGERFDFLVVLDFQNKLAVGRDAKSGSERFSCIKESPSQDGEYMCGEPTTLYFEVSNVRTPAGEKEFMHFTLWRNSAGVRAIVGLEASSLLPEERTFAKLLDNQFHNYLGSFDAGGTINFIAKCAEYQCAKCNAGGFLDFCNEKECHDLASNCWYSGGFLSGSCYPCEPKPCGQYTQKNACERCGTGCTWKDNKCA